MPSLSIALRAVQELPTLLDTPGQLPGERWERCPLVLPVGRCVWGFPSWVAALASFVPIINDFILCSLEQQLLLQFNPLA